MLGLTAAMAVAAAGSTAGQQFRSGVEVVRLPVIVTDRAGGIVRGLTRDDFVILEEGRPQDVAYFVEGAPGRDLPLRLGLLLDTSGSMELDLKDAANAAVQFVDTLEEATDVTFVDFDTTVQLGRFAPPSYPMLFERIRSRKPGRATALYDALAYYLQASAGRRGQHVLVLYTDGGDSASSITFATLQRLLRASDVLVYAIGYLQNQSSGVRTSQQMHVTQIARDTGGEAFFPMSASALDGVYERILSEINGRYTLGYVPSGPAEEGFRRIEVRLTSRGSGKVRTRPGYHVMAAAGGR